MRKSQPRTRLFLEPLEDRTLLSAATPNLQMTFATTTDARTVSVNYTISDESFVGQDVRFNVYRSAGYNSLNGAQLIGTATIPGSDNADLSLGSHTGVKLFLTDLNGQPLTTLTPNAALPFIVVEANPGGNIYAGSIPSSSASFETHVLGVISHGLEFDPLLWLENAVPSWETQLAAVLQQQDGYQSVLPFNWVRLSILPFPQALPMASNQLYQQVVVEADQLASQHPGDVVDINFIGHSRGGNVISEVLQDLVGTNDPALRGGYFEMTLLDPHPANLNFSRFSWYSAIPQANAFAALMVAFEILAHDPQVIVPPNVKQTQLYDEQTMAGQLGFRYPIESLLNLWGDAPSALSNQSGQPIESQNLTQLIAPQIGLIGHSEVHDWYLANVAQPDKTFTYFA